MWSAISRGKAGLFWGLATCISGLQSACRHWAAILEKAKCMKYRRSTIYSFTFKWKLLHWGTLQFKRKMHSYSVEAFLQIHLQRRLSGEHQKPGMMPHTCNPSTQEPGRSEGHVHFYLCVKFKAWDRWDPISGEWASLNNFKKKNTYYHWSSE